MAIANSPRDDVADLSLLMLARTGELPTEVKIDNALLHRARDHRVSALVHEASERQKIAGDPEVQQLLAADSLRTAGRFRLALGVLDELAQLVGDSCDIAVAKGVAVALCVYDDASLREFADIDVFVHHEELERFGIHLQSLGAVDIDAELLSRTVASGRPYEHAIRFGNIWVDVHSDIMNFVVPVRQQDLFWSRLVPLQDVAGSAGLDSLPGVLVLDSELRIIQALVNYSRDIFSDLRHLYDLRLMLEEDLDWDFVDSFSTAEGWYDVVASSLDIVCGYLQVPSPLPIRSRTSHFVATKILWPERRRLRGKAAAHNVRTGQARASLLIRGRRLEVLAELFRRVVPPHDMLELLGYGQQGPRVWRVLRYRWNQAVTLRSGRKSSSA